MKGFVSKMLQLVRYIYFQNIYLQKILLHALPLDQLNNVLCVQKESISFNSLGQSCRMSINHIGDLLERIRFV